MARLWKPTPSPRATPPGAGPSIRDVVFETFVSVMAFPRSESGTMSTTSAWRAGPMNANALPIKNELNARFATVIDPVE